MSPHRILIVEDHKEAALDLSEIAESLDCTCYVVDNKNDALKAITHKRFCMVLLDLEIKSSRSSIKAHLEHGKALLRELRQRYKWHHDLTYWLPIIVVSGYAREAEAVLQAMKEGATDIVHKPFKSGDVSEKLRESFRASGRLDHSLCGELPKPEPIGQTQEVSVVVSGRRKGRRTEVIVRGIEVFLTDSTLKTLLRLMIAHVKGKEIHKVDLGAGQHQGFKGISLLRQALERSGVDIVKTKWHGLYSLSERTRIDGCDVEALRENGDSVIAELGNTLMKELNRRDKV